MNTERYNEGKRLGKAWGATHSSNERFPISMTSLKQAIALAGSAGDYVRTIARLESGVYLQLSNIFVGLEAEAFIRGLFWRSALGDEMTSTEDVDLVHGWVDGLLTHSP